MTTTTDAPVLEHIPDPAPLSRSKALRAGMKATGRALGCGGTVLRATDEHGVVHQLVLPLQRLVAVEVRIRPALEQRIVLPLGAPALLEQVLAAAVAACGLPTVEINATFRSELYNAEAMGELAAAGAAAVRAVAGAAQVQLTDAAVAQILSEVGIDPVAAFSAAVLLNTATGQPAGPEAPRMFTASICGRVSVPQPLEPAGPDQLDQLVAALTAGDVAAVADVATEQARRVGQLDALTAAVLERYDAGDLPGALGVAADAAGGVVSVLFAGDPDGRAGAQRVSLDLHKLANQVLPALPVMSTTKEGAKGGPAATVLVSLTPGR